tara:strand:+ start:34396 stop:34623 length:228 start_codon:yes stop_codon:yes gene_type:complete
MNKTRKNDRSPHKSWFRTDRLLEENDNWFFLTREGTVEGPFESRVAAVERMEVYARIMEMDLVSEGISVDLQKTG